MDPGIELLAAVVCFFLILMTAIWIGIREAGQSPRRVRHTSCPHCGSAGDGRGRSIFRRISDPFALERMRYHCAITITGYYLQCRACHHIFFATDPSPLLEGAATVVGRRALVPVDFATVQRAWLEKQAYNRRMAFWLAQLVLVAGAVYGVTFAFGVPRMEWAVAAALLFHLLFHPLVGKIPGPTEAWPPSQPHLRG
jgi:hypothetical protein